MTIRELIVALGYEVDKKSEQNVEGSLKNIASKAKSLLGALGIAFSIRGLADLAQAAADVEALKSQFSQVFGDIEQEASDKLQQIADNVGSNVMRMKGSFTQIAAFAKTTGATEAEALAISERAMIAVADSAAFYDRSMEEATASLQSFLKGNFAQDAALGLSCTEITRNAKATELYGKEFKDLTEQQKQLTLLQMVEDANKLSGATDQAAREANTWTNQLGNLKQAIKDLKAETGATFLKPAIQVLKILASLVNKATKAISTYGAFLNREMERLKNTFKFLQPTVERVTKAISNGMGKAREIATKVANKFGGLDNVLRIVTITLVTLGALLLGPKILGALKIVGGFLKKFFAGVLNPAYLKMMAIVAVIVAIVLIVEDFIHFMQGNDSLLGSLLEKLGIDCDGVRTTIKKAWDDIKVHLFNAWEKIKDAGAKLWVSVKQAATSIFNALKAFWAKWGDDIKNTFAKVFGFMGDYFNGFVNVIKGVADFIGAVFSGDWAAAWQAIKDIFVGVWDMIVASLKMVWEWIKLIFKIALDWIKSLWTTIWNGIKDFFVGIWDGIVQAVTNFTDKIKNKVTDVATSIKDGIQSAIDWIKGLPAQALQWGKDMIQGLIDGITGMVGKIGDAVKGIGDKIRSFLHFSVPDEGPLTDYETWMPDFMTGLADGISSSEDIVLNKIRNLASSIKTLMNAATAKAGTASASAISNRTSNVTQNVSIANSYTGGSMETQRNVSKAMKKSAVDATTQMARSLAYARG